MAYRAYIYLRRNGRNPFGEYILSLNNRQEKATIKAAINRLITNNGWLPPPYAKKVIGKIWELRGPRGNRIFYFIQTGQEIIILDGYTKKRDRIESHILRKVLTYYQDFLHTGLRRELTSLKELYEEDRPLTN